MIGYRVVLRPRSLLEIGDLAAAFGRRHAREFLRLLPWVVVPAVVFWGLARFGVLPGDDALILATLTCSVTSGVFTRLLGELLLSAKVDTRKLGIAFAKSLPGWIGARLVGWLTVLVSFGIAWRWVCFLPEGKLLERGSYSSTLARSGALLRVTPGRALGFGVVTLTILVLGPIAGELLYGALRSLFSLPAALPSADNPSLAAYLGLAAVQPFLATMRFLLYIDCRTRREGWDLQVQMQALVRASESSVRGEPREAA